jgi:predicted transcriptional regulator
MSNLKITIGGSLANDGQAFLNAWHKAQAGVDVSEHVIAFESWEGLARVLTGERVRLLRHLHAHPAPSIMALARALGRQYRRVHDDVIALEEAGLLSRHDNLVQATADKITAELHIAA